MIRPSCLTVHAPAGDLLLTIGDEHNNVHHTNTFRMAEALIKADKRFDCFVSPGQRHGYGTMSDRWYWLRAEYFAPHLIDGDRWSANLAELDVEQEQTGGRLGGGRWTGGSHGRGR